MRPHKTTSTSDQRPLPELRSLELQPLSNAASREKHMNEYHC